MQTFETVLASLTALVCVLLLIRLAVGSTRRSRIDAVLRHASQSLRDRGRQAWQAARGLGRSRAQRQDAARAAEAAIERARRGTWEGNVYRPERFGKAPDRADAKNDRSARKPH